MNWIFEQPAWIVIGGMVAAALCGLLWANTGKNYWLLGMGGVIVVMIALLVTERMVETDAEALRRTVLDIAADVEKNDRTLLFKHIHSQATSLQNKANNELPNYNFSDCTVTKIYKVDIQGDAPPRSATVEFMVRAEGDFRLGSDAFGGKFLRYVTLFFKQEEDGTWKVIDYAHADPTQAWSNQGSGNQLQQP